MFRNAFNRVWQTLVHALRQGTSPKKLALTCALGVALGIFPVYGSTTLLCFGVALVLRLNVVVIQAVNYLLTPVQLVLLIPFMQGGIWLFGWPAIPLDLAILTTRIEKDAWLLVRELGAVVGGGVVVWMLVAAPLVFVLFYGLNWAIVKWQNRQGVGDVNQQIVK
ncbi:MAG: DUF2062 domain-containing protein [Cyclobacteriaceae bacterium]